MKTQFVLAFLSIILGFSAGNSARAEECDTALASGSAKVEDLVIIGSGPAGLTAAIYASRALLRPLMIEGDLPGGQLMTTTEVENYPGFPQGILGPKILEEMRLQAQRFGTRFVSENVTRVDFSQRPFRVWIGEQEFLSRSIIIATGSNAKYLGLESERKYLGRGVSACATCDGAFFKDVPVAIVGGGDTAMEEALFLTRFASQVYVVHRRESFRASKIMAARVLEHSKIKVIWNSEVEEIIGEKTVNSVRLKNNKTGEVTLLPVQGVFVAIGHQPNTTLFSGVLDLNPQGYILTRAGSTHTNIEGVYAAGDVQDPIYRQAVVAAGSGSQAAIDAERWLQDKSQHAKSMLEQEFQTLLQQTEAVDGKTDEEKRKIIAGIENLFGQSRVDLSEKELMEVFGRHGEDIQKLSFALVFFKTPVLPVKVLKEKILSLLERYEAMDASISMPKEFIDTFNETLQNLMVLPAEQRSEVKLETDRLMKFYPVIGSGGKIPSSLWLKKEIEDLLSKAKNLSLASALDWDALALLNSSVDDLKGQIPALQAKEEVLFNADTEAHLQLKNLMELLEEMFGRNKNLMHITDENFVAEVAQKKGLFVLDFGADWCGPCKMMKPHFAKVAAENSDPNLRLGVLDIDHSPNTAAQFGVRSVPTLILFKDGVEIHRETGSKTAAQILKFIELGK